MSASNSQSNVVRIIGGDYRSRRLKFLDSEGLRPTADRVRETLFNWLQPYVGGAVCLDLFAGSGALGIEALSRGAARVDFVEQNRASAKQLRDNLAMLNAAHAGVFHSSAEQWLQQSSENSSVDIVFMDPPFAQDLLYDTAVTLASSQLLKSNSLVYMEHSQAPNLERLPVNWSLVKTKRAGDVHYWLCQVDV